MKMSDAFSAAAIASVNTEAGSNKIPYLGLGLWPAKKKTGLDLKWIRTSKGLPVSLKPSAFDTKSTIRSRSGLSMQQTEMAYFKESMIVKEQDEQEIMRAESSADPFVKEALNNVYDDANMLIDGADVVPERMRMQLLSSTTGHPSISIQADGTTYSYNYDPDGTYAANNFVALSGTSMWSDTTNSDPMQDVSDAQDAVEAKTGTRPGIMIISKLTMNYLKKNAKVRAYVLAQNLTATVIMTDERVKAVFATELAMTVVVYTKQFKDEANTAQKFYPDGMAALVPADGNLGSTWYGMTPEERTLVSKPTADVRIVNTGVAVAVTITDDPVQTKTTVSEIVLPSFERMDETYQIKCY